MTPFIGDAGSLGKGVEEAGIVGNLVEPAPGSELGAITERAYAVAEGGAGQNGDVPHQKQGPGVHPDQSSSHGIGFAAAGETQARMSGAKGRDLMRGRPGRRSATLGGSAENRGGPLGEMTATRDVAVAVACSIMP